MREYISASVGLRPARRGNGKLEAGFFLLIGVCIFCIPARAKYGGGTGGPNDPYQIWTPEQMNAIGTDPNDWDRHFKLMADIDLSGYAGDAFNIMGCYAGWNSPKNIPFTGIFDGNCHTISNFNYTPSYGGGYIGLFGHISGENAIIKDVRLADPNVGGLATNVGALVGSLENGTVLSCYVAGASVSGFGFAGGLVGGNSGGTIEDCHAAGSIVCSGHVAGGLLGGNEAQGTVVDCSACDSISEGKSAGGLVGQNHGGIGRCYSSGEVLGWFGGGLVAGNIGVISDCYSVSFVNGGSGSEAYGGLAGSNHGIIAKCHASGGVSGENVGGLVGHNQATVADSYWDVQSSGATTSAGGTPKTTAEMKQRITFANWDFVGVWDMAENQTYPFLRWHPVGDLNYDYRVDLFDLAILTEHWLEDNNL